MENYKEKNEEERIHLLNGEIEYKRYVLDNKRMSELILTNKRIIVSCDTAKAEAPIEDVRSIGASFREYKENTIVGFAIFCSLFAIAGIVMSTIMNSSYGLMAIPFALIVFLVGYFTRKTLYRFFLDISTFAEVTNHLFVGYLYDSNVKTLMANLLDINSFIPKNLFGNESKKSIFDKNSIKSIINQIGADILEIQALQK